METIARLGGLIFKPRQLAEAGLLPVVDKTVFFKQCAAGLSATLLLTFVGVALHANLATAGLLYLLLTVSFAVHCGFWQASVISVAAILCEGYFFAPPMYSFYIADPQNGISIVIFEITALLVSRLAWKEKSHARETDQQRRRLDQLYAVSRGALLLDPRFQPESQLVALVRKEYGVEAVALTSTGDETPVTAGHWPFRFTAVDEQLAENSQQFSREGLGFYRRNLLLADNRTGALFVLGHLSPLSMDALSSLVSLALDRHRAFTRESAAEAARQAEQLRTTVLDGLAHAFKTPLTIIRAASSGLLATGRLDELQSELAELVDEQSIRLDRLASQLLKTARLDRSDICLQTEHVLIPLLVEEVVRKFVDECADQQEGLIAPRVEIISCRHNLCIVADHDLVACTLKELLENATKYSEDGSTIRLSISEGDKELTISVHSQGQVILLEDRERIFEQFYRCAAHRHSAPGAGIGLSVARRIMKAHGGNIWVISDEKEGTTFHISFPIDSHQRLEQNERKQACR